MNPKGLISDVIAGAVRHALLAIFVWLVAKGWTARVHKDERVLIMKRKYPAEKVTWREVKSSRVAAVGWDKGFGLYVRFKSGDIYLYKNVYRQRATACSRAASVGSYLARKIAPNHPSVKIA